ncbi:MAG: LPXTG cell wall anchor domain-containing protein [Actinobacteria bacterium]|nr:MAG: LPXTG cell wall anchor domain-containing protein [Actinomycetota bacterium]
MHGRAICLDLTWHASQIVLWRSHLALRDSGGRLAVVDRNGKTRAILNLRPAGRTTTTTTWAAAGLSGVGLAATALLLRRRRRQN